MKQLELALDDPGRVSCSPPPARDAVVVRTAAMAPAGPDEMRFELRRNPRRHSLGIEVHADLRVIVRAPVHCPAFEIERFVSERLRWIETQLARFRAEDSRRRTASLAYRAGELHRLLGRAYVLALEPAARAEVRLDDDRLVVGGRHATSPSAVQTALARWYRERAHLEFNALLDCWHRHPRFARYPRPTLQIRAMRTRWGSLGTRRGMTLNLVLVQAPRPCIEYVVVHELCHLRYQGHGRAFYRLLDGVMPDWRARKRTLEHSVSS